MVSWEVKGGRCDLPLVDRLLVFWLRRRQVLLVFFMCSCTWPFVPSNQQYRCLVDLSKVRTSSPGRPFFQRYSCPQTQHPVSLLLACLPLFCRTLLFVRNVNNSTDLAKRTSAMFVSDDHALTEPSTMNLMAKTMTEFFELGAMKGGQTAAAVEGEGQQKQSSPVQKNIEVTETTLEPHTF